MMKVLKSLKVKKLYYVSQKKKLRLGDMLLQMNDLGCRNGFNPTIYAALNLSADSECRKGVSP